MTAPDTLITFLPVRDLAATHAFYGDLLGLPLALDQGACRIYRVTPGGCIGFCRRPDAAPAPGVIITLVTADPEAWHARIAAAGHWTDGTPRLNETYRIHHFYTRDPDGWSVEVQRFEDPRWPDAAGA